MASLRNCSNVGEIADHVSRSGPLSRRASKQVRSPVWQATPTWWTRTSTVSPSQSNRTSCTSWVLPLVSLSPNSLAAARVEGRSSRGERAVKCFVIHPPDHQHLSRGLLLDDCGHQTGGIALEQGGDRGSSPDAVGAELAFVTGPIVPAESRRGDRIPPTASRPDWWTR